MQVVLANQFQQFLARHTVLHQINLHHVHIAEVVERVLGVIDVGYTSRHTCGKVPADLAEHHHTTACHILTAVVAGALDDGYGSRVAHTEALAYLAIDVQLARGGTVETGVAGNDIVFRMEVLMAAAGGQYRDASAAQALAEVVVALALQPDVETVHGEGTKRLTCRTLELDVDGMVRQTCLTILLGYLTTQHCRHGTVGILDGIVQRHLLLFVDGLTGSTDNLLVLHTGHLRIGTTVPIEGLVRLGLMQQAGIVDGLPLLGGSQFFTFHF